MNFTEWKVRAFGLAAEIDKAAAKHREVVRMTPTRFRSVHQDGQLRYLQTLEREARDAFGAHLDLARSAFEVGEPKP